MSSPSSSSWLLYFKGANLRLLMLGFAAGLPYLLVAGSLFFRLSEAGVDVSTIGFLSWVSLAYAVKWMWSPLVDQLPLPWLGRTLGQRRSWLLATQVLIAVGLVGIGWFHPVTQLMSVVSCTLGVAVAAATQDIALDAYRIESAPAHEQGLLAASYQAGYRLAMIWSGAGLLWITAWRQQMSGYDHAAWRFGYLVMALSMGIGIVTVLCSPEPRAQERVRVGPFWDWLKGALVNPFTEFLRRYQRHAILILALISIYRISDVVMGAMAYNFYQSLGFTKQEVATVSKVYGVIMTIGGTYVGGVLSLRFGIPRMLTVGALLAAGSNLLYAGLSQWGHDLTALMLVVSIDNLSSGIASAAFIAYLSSLTQTKHTATQYAILASLMQILPRFLAGFSGVYVAHWGYAPFFIFTAILGVPVLILTSMAERSQRRIDS
ncbi:MAG: AmpG family muropeptide MFS transporter [Holophagaceae bacterium]